MLYQSVSFLMLTLGIVSMHPMTFGLAYLVAPSKLECWDEAQWKSCTRDDVCQSKSIYRVAGVNNWSEKQDVLCADPAFLGYYLALGCLVSLLMLPFTQNFRKPIYCTFLMLSIAA